MTSRVLDLLKRLRSRGGDVAVAMEPDDDHDLFSSPPPPRSIRPHWLGYRSSPRRHGYAKPEGPGDLSPEGMCWWWALIDAAGSDPSAWGYGWKLGRPEDHPGADALWLPYCAMADPGSTS
jgi:hypothetical protein